MNPLKGLNALIIEPHPGMRASLHTMLGQCGLTRIDDAATSGQAIRMLAMKPYDLILCEYALDGGQDGQQMLEDVRHHRLAHPSTMFFMVTGEGQFSRVVSAAELQPTDYVLKPFTIDTLLDRVTRALDKRNAFMALYQMLETGGSRDAIAACIDGAAHQPRYGADFQRLRAELHVQLGEPELAEPIYADLYETKRIHWARLGQAKCLCLRERYPEAQAMLEALLAQNRNFLDAYDWLARTHEMAGDWSRAQGILEGAVELSPHAVRRLRHLGAVALEAGDADAAEKALRQVVSKARFSEFRDPEDHARLVQALLLNGDPVQAATVIHDLDKSLSGLRNTAVCSAISSAMLHDYTGNAGRLDEVLRFALAGCRRASGLSNGLKIELARTCLGSGRQEEAAEVLRDVMRNSGSQGAMNKAMRVLEQAGHADLAQQLAQQSRQEVADMVAAGAARAKRGDYRGAVDLMTEAVAKLPDNAQVVFNAAVAVLKCLENTGWDERLGRDALTLIGSVRRLDPANPKLTALSNLHEEILKKYRVRAGQWRETASAAN
ncbi:MAG: tetratricopeptide repeat protein [Pseudomonadota bacterium]